MLTIIFDCISVLNKNMQFFCVDFAILYFGGKLTSSPVLMAYPGKKMVCFETDDSAKMLGIVYGEGLFQCQ